MVVLAFDTTSPNGSAVLFRDLEQLGEVHSGGAANYSVALFEMVARLLGAAGLALGEVGLIAAATGPGSFTGIRVGLAAAQGWAKALGCPVRGVSVLEAMVAASEPHTGVAVPLLDARRAEFYLGIFRREATHEPEKSRSAQSGAGMVFNASEIASLVKELAEGSSGELDFITRENDQAALALSKQLPGSITWKTLSPRHASAIALVALRAAREQRLQQPEDLDACYIRHSDAELNWRE